MGFYTIAAFLIWLISYIIYLVYFSLDIHTLFPYLFLMINLLSSTFVFLVIVLFSKGRRVGVYMIIIYSFLILLLFLNVVFYRLKVDFITLPLLTQTIN